jgi:hypothetical protein
MKFADWLRGVSTIALADVNKVFDDAEGFVEASPLPSNIKTDTVQLLKDAKGDLNGLAGLAGTLAGNAAADAVDDLTQLFLETAQVLGNKSSSLSQMSVAEKTVLEQTWTAMKAQGDTLLGQLKAGLDPTKGDAPAAAQPAAVAGTAAPAPTPQA